MSAITESTGALLRDAAAELPEHAETLAGCARRLAEPMRVALVGTVKAGKSTLLNALVGEEIAPTDATECTRVVTWYARCAGPEVRLVELDGRARELPVRRDAGRLRLGLDGTPAERVDRLEVGWPSALLDRYTLVDTPGTASNSAEVSRRTLDFLDPERRPVDAVVYLMRARHDEDVALLRELRGSGAGVLGVLSRADELDPATGMPAAHAAADRLRTDPELAGLAQDVLAVSGLLAVRGRTLRQAEFHALAALAAGPDSAMISPGRLSRAELPGVDAVTLLERFGILGVRAAVRLIRDGAGDAPALAAALVEYSGLDRLRESLDRRFGARHRQLTALAVLRELRVLLAGLPPRRTARLRAAADRLLADTHVLTELRVLSTLDTLPLPEPTRHLLEGILGGHGDTPARRLGLPDDSTPDQLRAVAVAALGHWREQLADPPPHPGCAPAFRAAVRSCEAILAAPRECGVTR
jgi:hypothetical protein